MNARSLLALGYVESTSDWVLGPDGRVMPLMELYAMDRKHGSLALFDWMERNERTAMTAAASSLRNHPTIPRGVGVAGGLSHPQPTETTHGID